MKVIIDIDDTKIEVMASKIAVDLFSTNVSIDKKKLNKEIELKIKELVKENLYSVVKESVNKIIN